MDVKTKKRTRIAALIMACVLLLAAGGVTLGLLLKGKDDPGTGPIDNADRPWYETGGEDEPTPTTETYLIKNGASPYKIVLPENASQRLKFAANELRYFFEQATGVELPVIGDGEAENPRGKYLSVGATSVFRDSGASADYAELGLDGYRVKTHGDAIAMIGGSDDGTVYSVYGYLAKQFRLRIYTASVFDCERTAEAKLADLDLTDIPDIPLRTGGTALVWYRSETEMSRYRMKNMEQVWGLTGHSHFIVLPQEKYFTTNRDWYNGEGNQLSWINEEMRAEFVKNLKQIIVNSPDHIYFMLGIEDNMTQGDDGEGPTGPYAQMKAQLISAYKAEGKSVTDMGAAAYIHLLFINAVVREVNAWAAETLPGRPLEFGAFAYDCTAEPPVYRDSAGRVFPIEGIQAESNLGLMLAPIGSHASHPFSHTSNGASKAMFEGFALVTKKMYVWSYSTQFSDFLAPFNAWGFYKQNYMDFKRLGVTWLFEQGDLYYAPNFLELRQYLTSQLSWNSSLDSERLIVDFMKAYYGPAWSGVYEYFTLLRDRMAELEETYGLYSYFAYQLYTDFRNPLYFSKALLDQYERLFDKALAAVETIRESSPAEYARVRLAVTADRLPLRYLMLSMYYNYFDTADYLAMVYEFRDVAAQVGFKVLDEAHTKTVALLVDEWVKNAA
ncbi:MAG: DUF4838 domain-containing protein [Clostridiales bacterium]|jgi:hypothetical protein|nr:DUF4838 domain-containing protein [Clostridiales bacterium]